MRFIRWSGTSLFLAFAMCLLVIHFPQPLFAYSVRVGRLGLYSDRPFNPIKARSILIEIENRLGTSPINDEFNHDVFITNSDWRRRFFFNIAGGATAVNFYPLTNHVFLRLSDVDKNQVFNSSGKASPPPRTLVYYATHEIGHSLTAEHLGWNHLWNHSLPRWVREGYADYVGLGGHVDVTELHRRYQAGDSEFDVEKSHSYARFRLVVGFLLERQHWTVGKLLTTKMTLEQAEMLMNSTMSHSIQLGN